MCVADTCGCQPRFIVQKISGIFIDVTRFCGAGLVSLNKSDAMNSSDAKDQVITRLENLVNKLAAANSSNPTNSTPSASDPKDKVITRLENLVNKLVAANSSASSNPTNNTVIELDPKDKVISRLENLITNLTQRLNSSEGSDKSSSDAKDKVITRLENLVNKLTAINNNATSNATNSTSTSDMPVARALSMNVMPMMQDEMSGGEVSLERKKRQDILDLNDLNPDEKMELADELGDQAADEAADVPPFY